MLDNISLNKKQIPCQYFLNAAANSLKPVAAHPARSAATAVIIAYADGRAVNQDLLPLGCVDHRATLFDT
jgi:hypothetical protein